MTTKSPVFNVTQFEQRNVVPTYFTATQKTAVDLTASRVSANLDFWAQALGWSGTNYWQVLRDTVSQGRQLLGGTYGVYNSFAVADVLSVENWSGNVIVTKVDNLAVGQQAFLGDYSYTLSSVISNGETQTLQLLGGLTDQFLTDLSANLPLRLDVAANRPAPFYRPTVEASGDTSFVCGVSGTALTLYPSWDTQQTTPYKINVLIEGATYWFNRPVFLSYTSTLAEDVPSNYDENRNLWYFTLPPTLNSGQTKSTAYVVSPYSDTTAQVNASLQVGVAAWQDPSDWGSASVLKNFTGAWGNKGGSLPFNLAFDSLGVHGYSEEKSLYLGPVNRSVAFDLLVDRVYEQDTIVSQAPPASPRDFATWWNTESGVFSMWCPDNTGCGAWVEIEYRQPPLAVFNEPVSLSYTDVATWRLAAATVPTQTLTYINDLTGLTTTDGVVGLQGTLTGPGFVFLQKNPDGYWELLKIEYWDVTGFTADALLLPAQVPVFLYDSTGLLTESANYTIQNLRFSLQQNLQVSLTKVYTNNNWVIQTDYLLRYIANSRLFKGATTPVESELTWDWSDPDSWGRAAAVWYEGNWVDVTQAPFTAVPSTLFDSGVIVVYCDGALMRDGVSYQTETYSLMYVYNPVTGNFDFTYTPFTFLGTAVLPKITISDNLTSAFVADITSDVFSGVQYYMSPNAYDAQTPLRLWQTEDLQVAETLEHLAEENYSNPFRADVNTGPGPENWERFFVRLPPAYQRNGRSWDKANLVCQDFTYWGSSPTPEIMECPPEGLTPLIYEEAYLFRQHPGAFEYVYSEPYLYSNIVDGYLSTLDEYTNSGTFPVTDFPYDEWTEGYMEVYDPLHNRKANTTLPVGGGYGDWNGAYCSTGPCLEFTGFWVNDVYNGVLSPIAPPVWDASIYKFPPTCENNPETYSADTNHYSVCFAYFSADLSASEDPFFDVHQEAAWRYPIKTAKTGYKVPA